MIQLRRTPNQRSRFTVGFTIRLVPATKSTIVANKSWTIRTHDLSVPLSDVIMEGGFRIRSPALHIVMGASCAGKTTAVKKIISHADKLFEEPPTRFYWFQGIDTAEPPEGRNITVLSGLPDTTLLESLTDGKEHVAIIIDDCITEIMKNPEMINSWAVRLVHHRNLSMFFIVQSLYSLPRVTRINGHYVYILRSPSDKLSIQTLFRSVFPGKSNYAMECYLDATKHMGGFLLLDLHQQSEDKFRLLTDIFDPCPIVYQEKY